MDTLSQSRSKLDAVIFDWGNTIVDYPLGSAAAQILFLQNCLLHAVATATGVTLSADVCANRLSAFNEERKDHRVVHFADRLKMLFPEISSEHYSIVEQRFCEKIFACAIPCAGSSEAIRRIYASGLRIAILSNLPWGTSPSLWRDEFYRHLGSVAAQIPLICCDDVGFRKPHPKPFTRCVEILGCQPSRVLMVGDNYY